MNKKERKQNIVSKCSLVMTVLISLVPGTPFLTPLTYKGSMHVLCLYDSLYCVLRGINKKLREDLILSLNWLGSPMALLYFSL